MKESFICCSACYYFSCLSGLQGEIQSRFSSRWSKVCGASRETGKSESTPEHLLTRTGNSREKERDPHLPTCINGAFLCFAFFFSAAWIKCLRLFEVRRRCTLVHDERRGSVLLQSLRWERERERARKLFFPFLSNETFLASLLLTSESGCDMLTTPSSFFTFHSTLDVCGTDIIVTVCQVTQRAQAVKQTLGGKRKK